VKWAVVAPASLPTPRAAALAAARTYDVGGMRAYVAPGAAADAASVLAGLRRP
jgi:hypothetical protein